MPVPTLDDARKAADRLVTDHGVGQVMVYGSVARGEATPESDIDLVAVFDDLGDYRMRYRLCRSLTEAASAAAGCRVDVKVTDWAEWEQRSGAIPNSFEHHIRHDALILCDRPPPQAVDWRKEIGMPSSEQEEAERHIVGMREDLQKMVGLYLPDEWESLAPSSAPETVEWRRSRLKTLCADSAMCIEHGLKALIAIEGRWPERSHEAAGLIRQIGPASRHIVDAIPVDLVQDIHLWRQAGTYRDVFDKMAMSDSELCNFAERYIDAALGFVSAVMSRCEQTYRSGSLALAMLDRACRQLRHLRGSARLWDGGQTPL